MRAKLWNRIVSPSYAFVRSPRPVVSRLRLSSPSFLPPRACLCLGFLGSTHGTARKLYVNQVSRREDE